MEDHKRRKEDQIGMFRALLKSEITWACFLVAGVMGFVSSVVLPIQKLQLQVTQIQVDLAKEVSTYSGFDQRITELEIAHSRIESVLKSGK